MQNIQKKFRKTQSHNNRPKAYELIDSDFLAPAELLCPLKHQNARKYHQRSKIQACLRWKSKASWYSD